ncbi:MAG: hypothetical protein JSU61_03495 [Fidelibacterota bacterium]|nr:MAG: hypothetical protein JSU61_03495 [Candidatus Neomarinimicrobiota bacterium]
MIPSEPTPFNICVIRCPGPVPFFEAYREVAETVQIGLRKLGHDVLLSDHHIEPERANIIFGFHMLESGNLPLLPEGTIFYQLEQVAIGKIKPIFEQVTSRFTVWDFSRRNCETLRRHGIANVVHVPIGYVPELTRIPPAPEQDVDVLFYGLVDKRRLHILRGLEQAGLKVKLLQGVYGAERDEWIARSRVVLNMHLYEARIFELVRVFYLLANSKAVVSECGPATEIDDDLRDACVLVDYDELVTACVGLVRDEERRKRVEDAGLAVISARDEVAYLAAALEQTGLTT